MVDIILHESGGGLGAFGEGVLWALFQQSPISTVIYDPEGRLLAVNDAFRRLWGVGAEEVPPEYTVLADPQLTAAGLQPLVERAFAGEVVITPPVRYDVAAVAVGGTGRTVWTQGHFFPVRDAGGRLLHVVVSHIDLTERLAIEQAQRLLAESGTVLAGSLDVEQTLATLATRLVPAMGAWCVVFLAGAEGALRVVATASAEHLPADAVRRIAERQAALPAGEGDLLRAAMETCVAQMLPRLGDGRGEASDAGHGALPGEPRPASMMAVPLVVREQALGAIVLATDDRRYGADDLRLAEQLARRAAVAVDNARLYTQALEERAAAERAADRTDRLQRVTAALSRAVSAEEAGDVVLREVGAALGAVSGVLALVADDASLEIVRSMRVPAEVIRGFERIPRDAPVPIAEAVRSGESLYFETRERVIAQYPLLAKNLRIADAGAWAVVPLVGDAPLGALVFGFAESRPFSREDRQFVEALARSCAAALDRARLYEAERRARADADRTRQRTQDLLAGIGDALIAYDGDWRVVYINERGRAVLRDAGVSGDPIARVLWEMTPTIVGTETELQMRRAMEERVPVSFEIESRAARRWIDVRVYPTTEGVLAFWADVTEQRRARKATTILGDASAALAATLDMDDALRAIAQLLAARYTDYCVVHLLEPDGSLRLVELAHRDPARAARARALEARHAQPPDSPVGAPAVVRTGQPLLQQQIPAERLALAAPDPEFRAALEALGLRSSMVVPMVARERTLGTISFVSAESGRHYDEVDLTLAQELARRAAIAVDNVRLLHEAEAARHEAEEANRAKTEFLTTMSHELRTPLNAIAGYAELLEMGIHGPVTEQQREALGRIGRSQRHLLSLVNEVLHFARIDAGHVELDIRPLPAADALRALEPLIHPQAQARAIDVEWRDESGAAAVLADEDRLRQILLNLLSNAVKFTPSGGRIEVRCDADAEQVRFAVADNGPGIAPEHLHRVFDPFVQLDRSLKNPKEGTGLGLAISRNLAQAMGGGLGAESVPGEGSTFTLWLPRG